MPARLWREGGDPVHNLNIIKLPGDECDFLQMMVRQVCYNKHMLDKQTIEKIKKIAFTYIDSQKYRVFIFGSWATNTARKFSDIDIGISGSEDLPPEKIALVQDAFEDSDIPYTVDVVSFSRVSLRFKEVALQHVISLN